MLNNATKTNLTIQTQTVIDAFVNIATKMYPEFNLTQIVHSLYPKGKWISLMKNIINGIPICSLTENDTDNYLLFPDELNFFL